MSDVEKLDVYHKALALSAEISEIIAQPRFSKDDRLAKQLGGSSASVPSLIAEGSQQSTDRFFAECLYRARGESREARTQLRIACDRRHINEFERARLTERYEEVAKMLTGLIAYLKRSDRKNRG